MDLREGEPKMLLKVANTLDEPIVFKVKTTKPKRYVVKPNQGILAGRGSEMVKIVLMRSEKNELLQRMHQNSDDALDGALEGGRDRFLVQAVQVEEALYASSADMKLKEKMELLTKTWGDVPSSAVKKQKLEVSFDLGESENRSDPSAIADSVRRGMTARTGTSRSDAAASSAAAEGGQEELLEEVRRLRRQYDELVDFSVRLTAEREVLQKHLETTKAQWMKEMSARMAVENAISASSSRKGGTDSSSDGRGRASRDSAAQSSGFSVVQLFVIAVVMFLVGRLMK